MYWQGARESNPITLVQSQVSAPIDLPPTMWHPLKDSNLGMSESKSDALDQLGEEGINLVRVSGFEPESLSWQPRIITWLYYTRIFGIPGGIRTHGVNSFADCRVRPLRHRYIDWAPNYPPGRTR